jgi:hypothetical protein
MSVPIIPISSISFLLLLSLTSPTLANTEKAIFLAPEPVTIPIAHPTLSDLRLDTLTPANWSLRTQLNAQFPSNTHPSGTATWLILDNLHPNQRYEVRICWAATVRQIPLFNLNPQLNLTYNPSTQQPTEFKLDTFPLETVWDSPELIASLHAYSAYRHSVANDESQELLQDSSTGIPVAKEREASVLLLRILAAADYFTTDASLMSKVPPVDVDIILDPFLFNVLPRSIAGTACYIVGIAVAAFFIAGRIVAWIQELIAVDRKQWESNKKRQ